jgi:hypothetical protein
LDLTSVIHAIGAFLAGSDLLLLKSLAIYLVGNAVFTAILAGKTGKFSIDRLPDFLYAFAGPFFGLAVLAFLGKQDAVIHDIFLGAYTVYAASQAASLKAKVEAAFFPKP